MNDKQLINEIVKRLEEISSALNSLLWMVKDIKNNRRGKNE
jgi:hypothetical protein|tara:strand:+ start:342 stop:464 length:123 start_codon:yes stop_codon:yes gene_type:complete